MTLSKAHIDFLLQAPREKEIAVGYQDVIKQGVAFFFKGTTILGGRFAILEVECGRKGEANADWKVTEVLEAKKGDSISEAFLAMDCQERALEIYAEQSARVKKEQLELRQIPAASKKKGSAGIVGRKVKHLRVIK